MPNQPTQDEVLTASLKLVVDAFTNLGYEESLIFGKVNLILQGMITAEGTFSEEYVKLAKTAIDIRASKEFSEMLKMEDREETVKLVIPGGIGFTDQGNIKRR